LNKKNRYEEQKKFLSKTKTFLISETTFLKHKTKQKKFRRLIEKPFFRKQNKNLFKTLVDKKNPFWTKKPF